MTDVQRHSLPNDHCRAVLVGAQPTSTTHAGLWFDKFFTALPEGKAPKDELRKWELADVLAALPAPQAYADWFERWKAALTAETILAQTEDYDVIRQPFAVHGRMVIGLGADAPLENSITLHRTYGVPYIPGSALKGLAASYAYNRLAASDWRADLARKADRKDNISEFYTTLFGTTDEAGFITFFDALYIPDSAENDRPLRLDVLTVHHQAYYQGDAPPADWDSPIPVPFLSAVGSYLIVLAGPKLWVAITLNLLKMALMDVGIGAKTSSGYGRMRLAQTEPRGKLQRHFEPPKRREQALPEQPSAQPRQTRFVSATEATVRGRTATHEMGSRAGTIQRYLSDRKFGFIRPDEGGKDVFFHIREFKSDSEPVEGARVVFKVRPGRKPDDIEAYDVHLETR